MNPRIPDPSDHPSFYDPEYGRPNLDAYANGIMAEIEDRAENAMAENSPAFHDWLLECGDMADYSKLAALALEVSLYGARRPEAAIELAAHLARIRKDWVDEFVDQCHQDGTYEEIGLQLHQDAKDYDAAMREEA